MKRRAVIGAIGASAVSGCTSFLGTDGDCSNAEPMAARSCERDGVTRFELAYEELSTDATDSPFTLGSSEDRVGVGERITFSLTYTAWTGSGSTGNRRKYSIERLVDDGWQSIYVADDPGRGFDFTDGAVSHGYREGFTWEFTATTEGLGHDKDGIVVCPEAEPGWYRFVYWGLSGERSLGTCFEIVVE